MRPFSGFYEVMEWMYANLTVNWAVCVAYFHCDGELVTWKFTLVDGLVEGFRHPPGPLEAL